MTCKQLGGACDMEFHASSLEEMASLGKKHGMEMIQKGDEKHLKAMDEMKQLMTTPDAMKSGSNPKEKNLMPCPITTNG